MVLKKNFNFIQSIIFSIISGATSLVFAYTVKKIIDVITKNESQSWVQIILISIALLMLTVLIDYGREFFISNVIKYNNYEIKNSLFESAFLNKDSSIDYISVLTNDINTIEIDYIRPFFDLIMYISMFIFASVRLILYNWIHAIVMILIALISVCISFCTKQKIGDKRISISLCQENYTSKIKDMFCGMIIVRQFLALKKISNEHSIFNKKLENKKYEYNIFYAKVNALSTIFSMIMFFSSFLIGAYFVQQKIYTLGIMMSTIQLINNIVIPLQEIIPSINKINGSTVVLKKIMKLRENNLNEDKKKYISSVEKIEIKNLDFGFNNSFKFKNLDLDFIKNKKYAIVGESGSGKSTLLNLIVKEYEINKNKIFINNMDINEISIISILNNISYMNQNIFLFNDTIKNNITLYNDVDEVLYKNAIRSSGLEKVLKKLPEEDMYMIKNNGRNLSGGQVQRIALARVLLKKSNIIILDEAFAALDPKTANEIMSDILKLNCMIIMVIHKYEEKFLRECDSIIVLENGSVIEIGNFEQLISKNGYFYNLYNYNNIKK